MSSDPSWAERWAEREGRTALVTGAGRARSRLARVVTAEEVAEAIVFLAGDRASAFTAGVLSPDGGLAATFSFPRH